MVDWYIYREIFERERERESWWWVGRVVAGSKRRVEPSLFLQTLTLTLTPKHPMRNSSVAIMQFNNWNLLPLLDSEMGHWLLCGCSLCFAQSYTQHVCIYHIWCIYNHACISIWLGGFTLHVYLYNQVLDTSHVVYNLWKLLIMTRTLKRY